jgi:hypothetical protein
LRSSSTTSPPRADNGLVGDGLVEMRVEIGACGLDGRDAALAHEIREGAMDELDASPVGLRGWWRIGCQRPFEVVHHRQQIAKHIGRGPLGEFLALALDALAEVVELRALPEQPVVELVALFLELLGRGAGGRSVGGLLGVSVWVPTASVGL